MLDKRLKLGLLVSICFHLLLFAIAPGLQIPPIEPQKPDYIEVTMAPIEEQDIEDIPKSGGFVPIGKEELPGQEWKISQGAAIVEPNPVISPPETTSLDRMVIFDESLLMPSNKEKPPQEIFNTTAAVGLQEGLRIPPSLLAETGEKLMPAKIQGIKDLKPKAMPEQVSTVEGELSAADLRGPVVNRIIYRPPPPTVRTDTEVTIQLKFWVRPNGWVGKVVPERVGNAEFERIAIDYLKQWRFSELPPDAPQQNQWGILVIRVKTK